MNYLQCTRQLIGMVFCFAFLTADAQTVDLKLKLAKGDVYRYTYDYHVDQEIGDQPIKTVVIMGFSMTVTGEEGKNIVLLCTYDRFAMKMESGETVAMDADTDKTPPTLEEIAADQTKVPAKIFQALKGQQFTMQINEAGELSAVTGFAKIVDNVVDSAALWFKMPDAAKAQMREKMAAQFNEKSTIEMMQQSFNFLPGKPVQVGATWNKAVTASAGNMTNTYTVKSITGNEMVLSFKSKVDGLNNNGVTLQGDQWGEMTVDIRTAMQNKCTIEQNMTGDYNGTAITLTSKGTITRQ